MSVEPSNGGLKEKEGGVDRGLKDTVLREEGHIFTYVLEGKILTEKNWHYQKKH